MLRERQNDYETNKRFMIFCHSQWEHGKTFSVSESSPVGHLYYGEEEDERKTKFQIKIFSNYVVNDCTLIVD